MILDRYGDVLPHSILKPRAAGEGNPLYVALSFADEADLITLQGVLRQLGYDGEWQEPSLFHCTLLVIEDASDEQVAALTDGISLPVRFGVEVASLGTFEAEDSPLIANVVASPALIRVQQEFAAAALRMGLPVGAYFRATGWKPHITLAYDSDAEMEGLPPLDAIINLPAKAVLLMRDDYRVVRRILLPEVAPDRAFVEAGGADSGYFAPHHRGIPGHRGGSLPSGGYVEQDTRAKRMREIEAAAIARIWPEGRPPTRGDIRERLAQQARIIGAMTKVEREEFAELSGAEAAAVWPVVGRHYGPGPHPGTGTEQAVHAAGGASVAEEAKPRCQTAAHMEAKLLDWYNEADLLDGIWIGPTGKCLVPNGDHQATAFHLMYGRDRPFDKRESGAGMWETNQVIESGLIRYNITRAIRYSMVDFDLPSDENLVTEEQRSTMAAIVTILTRANGGAIPALSLGVGGMQQGAGSRLIRGEEAYRYIGLSESDVGGIAALASRHYGPGPDPGTRTGQAGHPDLSEEARVSGTGAGSAKTGIPQVSGQQFRSLLAGKSVVIGLTRRVIGLADGPFSIVDPEEEALAAFDEPEGAPQIPAPVPEIMSTGISLEATPEAETMTETVLEEPVVTKSVEPTPASRPEESVHPNDLKSLLVRLVDKIEKLILPSPVLTLMVPEQKPPEVHIYLPEQATPTVNITLPEQAAPVVNLTLPEENPPEVHFHAPEQAAPVVNVTLPAPVVNVAVPETNVTVQPAVTVVPPEVTVTVPRFPRHMTERQMVQRNADKTITEISGEREYWDDEDEESKAE